MVYLHDILEGFAFGVCTACPMLCSFVVVIMCLHALLEGKGMLVCMLINFCNKYFCIECLLLCYIGLPHIMPCEDSTDDFGQHQELHFCK